MYNHTTDMMMYQIFPLSIVHGQRSNVLGVNWQFEGFNHLIDGEIANKAVGFEVHKVCHGSTMTRKRK